MFIPNHSWFSAAISIFFLWIPVYSSEYQKEWKLSKIIEGLNQIDKDHYLTELQVSSNFSLGI